MEPLEYDKMKSALAATMLSVVVAIGLSARCFAQAPASGQGACGPGVFSQGLSPQYQLPAESTPGGGSSCPQPNPGDTWLGMQGSNCLYEKPVPCAGANSAAGNSTAGKQSAGGSQNQNPAAASQSQSPGVGQSAQQPGGYTTNGGVPGGGNPGQSGPVSATQGHKVYPFIVNPADIKPNSPSAPTGPASAQGHKVYPFIVNPADMKPSSPSAPNGEKTPSNQSLVPPVRGQPESFPDLDKNDR